VVYHIKIDTRASVNQIEFAAIDGSTCVNSSSLSINCTAYAEPSYKVICESEVMWKEVYGVHVHLMQYTSNTKSLLEDLRKITKAE